MPARNLARVKSYQSTTSAAGSRDHASRTKREIGQGLKKVYSFSFNEDLKMIDRRLRNGANIVAIDFDSRVILAKYDGNHDEWITWSFSEFDGIIECFWGHYFKYKSDAKADFLVRSANL
jgi:hypothetical protein